MAGQVATHVKNAVWPTRLRIGGVVGSLLLLCLAAGWLVGMGHESRALLIILGAASPIAIPLLARRFDLAVLALSFIALAVPLDIPTGTQTRLPAVWALALGLCSMWFLSMFIRRQFSFLPNRLNRPLFAFGLICCFSLFWGIIWRDPGLLDKGGFILIQVVSLITMLISIGATLLIGNFIKTEAQLKYFVASFVIFGAMMTIGQLFNIPHSFLADRGLWGTWTAVTAYGLLIGIPKLRWYWRVCLLALVVSNIYLTMIVNSGWLSGWIPTLFALAMATLLRSFKLFVVFIAVVAVISYMYIGFFYQVAEDNVKEGDLERIEIAEQSGRVIRQHWLFGTGPAGYALYYVTYYRDTARSTHNNYLDILAQFGFVGMAIWLWLSITAFVEGCMVVRIAPPGFLRALAIITTAGWFGAQLSMLLGDWVLPFAYNQGNSGYRYTVYTWLFLGTLISIRHIINQPDQRITA